MSNFVPLTDPPESEAARQRRLEWEAKCIAEGLASAEAGHLIDGTDIDAWIDSLDTDHELPPPRYPGEPEAATAACQDD